MTDRLSFDRVADIYDQTRALPEWVTAEVADRLAAEARRVPGSSLLELGVGTGRIALPLVSRGVSMIGVDISPAMLAQLRLKLESLVAESRHPASGSCSLALADAGDLPFRSGAFHCVLAVHVLHLLPDLEKALDEVARVLAPEGALLLAGDGSAGVTSRVRARWNVLIQETGCPLRPRDRMVACLKVRAETFEELAVLRWDTQVPVAESLRRIEERAFSDSWSVPEQVHQEVTARLREWVRQDIGIDAVETVPREFRIARIRLRRR